MKIFNFKHLFGALFYSLSGLRTACKEQAFRHEIMMLPVIIALLAFIRPGAVWTAILIAAWIGTMAAELLNSAIEEALDLITTDYNLHVKYGKDMASAAVALCLIANAVLWGGMLWSVYAG